MTDKPDDDPRSKGGRPRAPEPGASVSTWIRTSEYDRLIKLANLQDRSVSSLVAELVRLKLK